MFRQLKWNTPLKDTNILFNVPFVLWLGLFSHPWINSLLNNSRYDLQCPLQSSQKNIQICLFSIQKTFWIVLISGLLVGMINVTYVITGSFCFHNILRWSLSCENNFLPRFWHFWNIYSSIYSPMVSLTYPKTY